MPVPAPPRCPAVRRAAPTHPRHVYPNFGLANLFPDMPCMKKGLRTYVQKQLRRRRYTGRQPRTKSARADTPRVNHCFCSIGLHRNSFVRASRDTPSTDFFAGKDGKSIGCFLGEPTCRRLVLPVPAPPPRPAVRRPAPIRPWYTYPGVGLDKKIKCEQDMSGHMKTFKDILEI